MDKHGKWLFLADAGAYETTASLPGMDKHGKQLFLVSAGAYEAMASWRAWRLGRLRGRRKGGYLK